MNAAATTQEPRRVATPLRARGIAIGAVGFLCAAVVVRVFTSGVGDDWPWYAILFGLFFALSLALLRRARAHGLVVHVLLVLQSLVVLALVALEPGRDIVTALCLVSSYLAALAFTGRALLIWVTLLSVLTCASLMVLLEPLRGLALALAPTVGVIAVAGMVTAGREVAAGRDQSRSMLLELERTHQRLQEHALQVDELAAMEERERLARELHDSVTQTMFSIQLTTRSAQILLEKDAARVPEQLDRLQVLTQNALAQLRSLIAELHPKT